jgi:hypothetical protein
MISHDLFEDDLPITYYFHGSLPSVGLEGNLGDDCDLHPEFSPSHLLPPRWKLVE